MLKFYHKLLVLLVSIVVISFIVVGILIHQSIYHVIVDDLESTYEHEADKIAQSYRANDYAQIQKMAKELKETVIVHDDKTGQTLKYRYGPKINQDIYHDGRPAHLIYDKYQNQHRYSYTTTEGAIRVTVSGHSEMISYLQTLSWIFIFIIMLLVIISTYVVVRYVNRTYITPINEITYATRLLADGYYHVRVPESNVKETKELFVTTNMLAQRLQQLNNAQKIQTNRLITTIESIPSAVLMINKESKIVIANQTYYKVFNPKAQVVGQFYGDFVPESINALIIEAYKYEEAVSKQLDIKMNHIHHKYFEATCVPILSRSKKNIEGIVVVLHDITNIKKLEQMRKDFVANVSHELKTPITSIKGFAETLLDGAKNDAVALDEFLEIMLKESNRIESLVKDLLSLSQIEQQRDIEKYPVNLSYVAHNVIDTLQGYAERKSIKLVQHIDPDVMIQADTDKMKQVLMNLLTNAINYSTNSEQVTVTVRENETHAMLSVSDNGIGIAKDEQDHVFERFYRIDKARSRDSGGTGLGLSIVKHIVESYDGMIELESALGEGATFTVSFKKQHV